MRLIFFRRWRSANAPILRARKRSKEEVLVSASLSSIALRIKTYSSCVNCSIFNFSWIPSFDMENNSTTSSESSIVAWLLEFPSLYFGFWLTRGESYKLKRTFFVSFPSFRILFFFFSDVISYFISYVLRVPWIQWMIRFVLTNFCKLNWLQELYLRSRTMELY